MIRNLAFSYLEYKNPTDNGWIFLLQSNSKIGQIKYFYMYLTKCFNLTDFEIQHKYQNKGYGKYLLHQTINFLIKKHQSTKILLHVKTNNINALKVYKDAGFKIIQAYNNTTQKIYLMQWMTSTLKNNLHKI